MPEGLVFQNEKYFNTLNCRSLRKLKANSVALSPINSWLIFHSVKVFQVIFSNTKLKIIVLNLLFIYLRLSNIFILQ